MPWSLACLYTSDNILTHHTILTILNLISSLQILNNTLHGQRYVDTCSSNISFQNNGHEYGPLFVAITTSTLLWRLSTRCWIIAAGTYFHSATKALVRSGMDVGLLGLARSWHSNSSQRAFGILLWSPLPVVKAAATLPGVEVRALCRPVKLFQTDRQIISVWPSLYALGHCYAETGKDLPQTVATKLEAQNRLECQCMLQR
jgi:hypothetical protein